MLTERGGEVRSLYSVQCSTALYCTVHCTTRPRTVRSRAASIPSHGGWRSQTTNIKLHFYVSSFISTVYCLSKYSRYIAVQLSHPSVYLHLCFPPVRTDDSSVVTRIWADQQMDSTTDCSTAAFRYTLQHKKHNFGPQINEPYEETSLLR